MYDKPSIESPEVERKSEKETKSDLGEKETKIDLSMEQGSSDIMRQRSTKDKVQNLYKRKRIRNMSLAFEYLDSREDTFSSNNRQMEHLYDSFCLLADTHEKSELDDHDDDSIPPLTVCNFVKIFRDCGLRISSDPIFEAIRTNLTKFIGDQARHHTSIEYSTKEIGYSDFCDICSTSMKIIERIANQNLAITNFDQFRLDVTQVFKTCQANNTGDVATYIPQLATKNPNLWGVSICTVDGQRMCVGDTQVPFCVQSCSKALTYAIALNDHGPEIVHEYVGQEPSGLRFNTISLDESAKPHNPMVNSGAITITSLLKPGAKIEDKFDYLLEKFKKYAGGEHVGFNNSVYLSEKQTADRNYALAYYMREQKCFPEGTHLMDTMDLYFQMCSCEVTSDVGSVMAATLANAGVCPITNERLNKPSHVKHVLSLMLSCGMYDYSGQFAFHIGLPAKSGVAGAILLVIPNVAGVCIYSPRLDKLGNSARGIQFCKELVSTIDFQVMPSLLNKHRISMAASQHSEVPYNVKVLWAIHASSTGDLKQLFSLAQEIDLDASDYDRRTCLHLAASEGHVKIVTFLLERKVNKKCEDRFGNKPIYYAKRNNYDNIVKLLEN